MTEIVLVYFAIRSGVRGTLGTGQVKNWNHGVGVRKPVAQYGKISIDVLRPADTSFRAYLSVHMVGYPMPLSIVLIARQWILLIRQRSLLSIFFLQNIKPTSVAIQIKTNKPDNGQRHRITQIMWKSLNSYNFATVCPIFKIQKV